MRGIVAYLSGVPVRTATDIARYQVLCCTVLVTVRDEYQSVLLVWSRSLSLRATSMLHRNHGSRLRCRAVICRWTERWPGLALESQDLTPNVAGSDCSSERIRS